MRDTAPAAERLPDDIARRMRLLGEQAAARTLPEPAIARAVRHERRRRVVTGAGTFAGAVAVTVVAAAVLGAGQDRTSVRPEDPPLPSASPSVVEPMPTPTRPGPYLDARRPGSRVPPPPTGFGATAGSLAADGAWLDALRGAIAARNHADGPQQVHVLWAGELAGKRYAVTVAPDLDRSGSGSGDMSWQLYAWQVSADGRGLVQGPVSQGVEPGQDLRTVSADLEVPDDAGQRLPDRSVVLVVDARARSVESGGAPRYPATGGKERTFTPLRREGMVWPGVRDRDAVENGMLRITAANGTRTASSGQQIEGVRKTPSLAPVAPAGADPALVACAAGAWTDATPEGVRAELVGTTTAFGAGYGVGVLRAREGGYLLGVCASGGYSSGERFVAPAPAGGSDRLTALLAMDGLPGDSGRLFAVVAPADAVTVELGGRSVPVHERIAVIDLGERRAFDGLRVTAHRADGSVAGTSAVVPTDRELDDQAVG